jgi:hypothetical protein
MIRNGPNLKFKNSCLENETAGFQAQRCLVKDACPILAL